MSKVSAENDGAPSANHRARQLRHAAEHLEAVLQSLDLRNEPQLAEEAINALQATDRAYALEQTSRENQREGFVFE